MVKVAQYAKKVASLQKQAARALTSMLRNGIKDLPRLIEGLENLGQRHIEFTLKGWDVILHKK